MFRPHKSVLLNDQMQESYPCASTADTWSLCCMEWLSSSVNWEFTWFQAEWVLNAHFLVLIVPCILLLSDPQEYGSMRQTAQIKEGEICERVLHSQIIRKAKKLNGILSIECPVS